MEQTTQPEPAQTQAPSIQAQQELANMRAYARELFLQNEDLSKRLEDLAFVEHSYGWHVLKHLRLLLRILLTEGPLTLERRLRTWLARNRGHYRKLLFAVSPASTFPLSSPTIQWTVAHQHIPETGHFRGVSIVIPVFNALEYAQACVESIYRAQGTVPTEVIVVDNGSQPEIRTWLEEECQKRDMLFYISLSHNLGFAKAVNLGIQKARGQYIIIHNSDTVATSGWLNHLVNAAESDPQLGIVSPVTNYVGEGLQMDHAARGISASQAERYATKISARNHLIYVPDRLVFFSVLVKRSVIDRIGGLDESFGLGNFEDEDFCLRARLAGFKLAIVPNTFVFHHGSKTFAANNINHADWMRRNQCHYLNKVSAHSVTLHPLAAQTRITASNEVSVIIRTRNRPETLRLALTSLANQTYRSFEVVLVNDGGAEVDDLLSEFQHYFPIRSFHHRECKGPGAALNTGVRAANGRWITYLDDDDIVYPHHIETLWTALTCTKGNYRFAYTNYNRALIDKRGTDAVTIARLPMPGWRYDPHDLYVVNHLPLHTWMHSRDCLEQIGAFDESLIFFEDWDFLIRAATRYSFLSLKHITCEYRFYLDSQNSMVERRERHLEQIQRIYERYPVNNPLSRLRRQRMRRGIISEIAHIERVKEAGQQQILSNTEMQQHLLAIIGGFQMDAD